MAEELITGNPSDGYIGETPKSQDVDIKATKSGDVEVEVVNDRYSSQPQDGSLQGDPVPGNPHDVSNKTPPVRT